MLPIFAVLILFPAHKPHSQPQPAPTIDRVSEQMQVDRDQALYDREATVFAEQCAQKGNQGVGTFEYHSFGRVVRICLPCTIFQKESVK